MESAMRWCAVPPGRVEELVAACDRVPIRASRLSRQPGSRTTPLRSYKKKEIRFDSLFRCDRDQFVEDGADGILVDQCFFVCESNQQGEITKSVDLARNTVGQFV